MKSTLNISLPMPLKKWVEKQVAAGRYGNTSDLFGALIRAERQRQLHEQIETNLHAALASGPSTPMTPEDWERLRQEGRKRILGNKRKKQ